MMSKRPNKQTSQAELDAVLDQLIEAYDMVMKTIGHTTTTMFEMREDIRAIEERVNNDLAESVSATRLWRGIAKIHRDKVEELRIQIELLNDDGRKIEVVVPVKVKGKLE